MFKNIFLQKSSPAIRDFFHTRNDFAGNFHDGGWVVREDHICDIREAGNPYLVSGQKLID
jgi:hypothetical protein